MTKNTMSICRICFCSKPRKDLADLYLFKNEERQSYKDILMFCLGIEINEDSNISKKLCVKCYRKIIQFYQFKVLALNNDEHLRSSALDTRVLWVKEDIKIEKETEHSDTDADEPLMTQVKDEDNFDFDSQANEDNVTNEIKYEFKQEDNSDSEFLSVIKKLKIQAIEEDKQYVPVQKKKRSKAKVPKELKTKKQKNKGVYEGICEHCGKVYKDLRQHVRLQHIQKESRKVRCEHCDKMFCGNVPKRRHVQRRHLAVKQQCQLCERSVADLKMHMRTMHDKESLKFKCAHCDLKFLTQGRLNGHISVHTKDRPFACDVCGSCFRLKLSLTNHKRQVHNKEKSHLCQFCSKSFFKKHHLVVHLRSHTNEKPYQCPDCGKYYQSTTSLKNHRLTHSNEKKVSCTMCDATFISKSYLGNHMLSHLKEKRYPCQYCNVKFHRSDHRKRHEYTAHLKFTGNVVDVPPSYTPKKRTASSTPRRKLEEDESTVSSVGALDTLDCVTDGDDPIVPTTKLTGQ